MTISPKPRCTASRYQRVSPPAVCLFAALILIVLAPVASVAGDPASSEEIIEMLQADISEEIVMAKIDADGCECDTSGPSIIAFKEAGASDELVVAIIYAAKGN